MTTNMLMTMNPQGPRAQAPRERLASFEETPTELLTLSPEFLDAVRQVAPKVRRRILPYGLLLAAAAAMGVASGRRLLPHRDTSARISTPASPVAIAAPSTADSADRDRGSPPADTTPRTAQGDATTAPPVAADAPVSGDDPARAEKSKTTRIRHAKTQH
jgi:hypothetical protein